jgi:hypothetical protein
VISLLLVQSIGYGALFYFNLATLDSSALQGAPDQIANLILSVLVLGILLLPTIAGLIATINTLRRGRHAWNNAILVQGLSLAISLMFYFLLEDRTFFTYSPMAYALFLVVYLMLPDVQAAFLPAGGKT